MGIEPPILWVQRPIPNFSCDSAAMHLDPSCLDFLWVFFFFLVLALPDNMQDVGS